MTDAQPYLQANAPAGRSNRIWIIVAVVVILVLCVCLLIPVFSTGLLALLGPSIGNVFSNIVTELPSQ
jgi:hypothetical protein